MHNVFRTQEPATAKVQKLRGLDALRALNPTLAKPLERALVASQSGLLQEALREFGACCAIDPTNKAVLHFGSSALQQAYFLLKYREPPAGSALLASYREAVWWPTLANAEFYPGDAIAAHNVGKFLQDDGSVTESVEWYRRALALDRSQVESWGNLGTALYTLGKPDEAERCWSKCVAFNAENASGASAQAYIWIRRGDYARGWKALNRRWDDEAFTMLYGRRDLLGKPWTGQPLRKRESLLIHGEQGLGDHVQFARFVPELKRLGYRVAALETRASLKTWFESALPDVPVVVRDSGVLPYYTHHVPLMSLPGILGLRDDAVPPPLAPLQWTQPSHDGPKRVGLVWYGTTGNPADSERSIPHDLLAELANVPRGTSPSTPVTWVPLQYDPRGEASMYARAWLPTAEPCEPYADVHGLAERMMELDCVVAVDTLAAHVAGSIGCPTLVLHRFNREWRWGQGTTDTPWYPSHTMLTQPAPAEWGALLRRATDLLRR